MTLAFDDLLQLRNGSYAYERYRGRHFGQEQVKRLRSVSKRPRSDDSPSEEDELSSRPISRDGRQSRRSTRQKTASRQASLDSGFLDVQDEDLDDEPSRSQRRQHHRPNQRVTRASNTVAKTYALDKDSSEDELLQDSDDGDAFIPVVSDLSNKRFSARKRKARFRHGQRHVSYNDRESSIEFESTRKSGRSTRPKSYREVNIEDGFEAVDEKSTSAPKHVSVKEVFQVVTEESEFGMMHSTVCESCHGDAGVGRGLLLHCQGCSYSYHQSCLGQRSARDHRVTKTGLDNFVLQCRVCVGIYHKKDTNAPDHTLCQFCKSAGVSCAEFSTKKTPKQEEKLRQDNGGEDPVTEVNPDLINNASTLLFRCTSCKRGYHFEHLPSLTDSESPVSDLRTKRMEEYSMHGWRCKDCIHADHKIHALVAWRPSAPESYIAGTPNYDLGEDEKEYLVKWEKRSHFHDTWMPGAWVFGLAASAMRSAFSKRPENYLPKMTTAEAIEEEWLLADVFLSVKYRSKASSSSKARDAARIGDVVEVFVKFQGLGYQEAVWDTPPPEESGAIWEAFRAAYDEYLQGVYFPHVSDQKMSDRIKQFRVLHFADECELKEQPQGLKRGKLMEYQLEGVNWLLHNFHKSLSVILADEMGLGKTIQIISLLSTLVEDKPKCWPFLIVVPSSTCPNWRRELKNWAPDLRVVTYYGGKVAQDLAYRHELFPDGAKGTMRAHVVIMSYEAAVEVKSTFRSVKWAGLIVDEGQRLKNERSLLYLALQDMEIPYRVLLTGTPLQNNKRELFNLLQFVDSRNDAEELDAEYADLNKENLQKLHKKIRPYFLRRTKVQVLKFLPPMAQIILPVTMTFLQEKLSKSIIARNPELIKAIVSKGKVKAGERKSLNNILMELRRCLCHPFLFSDSVEDRTVEDPAMVQQNLVEASGKLLLLNLMLPKLKERGHRVLIFSQFLMSLTILEDFLTALGMQHARIDGSLTSLEKQKRIDAFNAPDSPLFAMLLSTRAGGVGINLATADTVIIYDPDFNPHQDIQALSRAHRIGQKDKVLCFQLMTKDTVEEKIMEIGRKKMALDHALIENMDADEDAGESLESILKHGAETLFSGNVRDKIVYDEASVDKLIDRSQMESTTTDDDQTAESQFSFARVWANDEGVLTANQDDNPQDDSNPADPSVWENILRQRAEEHERELAANKKEYGRGARRRNPDVQYRVGPLIKGFDDDFLIDMQPHDQDGAMSDETTKDDAYSDDNGNEDESEPEEEPPSGRGAKGTKRSAPANRVAPSPSNKRAKVSNTSSSKRRHPGDTVNVTTSTVATSNNLNTETRGQDAEAAPAYAPTLKSRPDFALSQVHQWN